MLVLALLKIRLPLEAILNMRIDTAFDYCDAWSELTQPDKPKKAIVLKKPK
jgi:hypothetical protein